ncbi:MAG: serine/threonine-protein kinase [Actinomycetota bacterium]
MVGAQKTAGTLLSHRYELKSTIGKGGMGVVWRAQDTLLRREVAIKEVCLPAELSATDSDAVQARVLREARTAGRLSHSAVVTVYDVVRDGGVTYIIMELVEGTTLDEVIAGRGPLQPSEVADIGLHVLGALEEAHAQGIVHRDVKPGNLIVTSEGRVKLADFGIASLKGDPKLTATGILLGSPSYMAPEQAQDEDSGPPADIWALGATLYYAVEGRAPFDRGQPIPTLTAVVYDEPEPPERAGALGPTVMAMLEKSPRARPSGASLTHALREVARGRAARPAAQHGAGATAGAGAGAAERPARAASPTDVWSRDPERPRVQPQEPEPPRRGVWPFVAGIIALLAVAVALLFTLLDGGGDAPKRAGEKRPAAASGNEGADKTSGGGGNDAPGNENETGQAASDASGEAEAVPEDWATHVDKGSGFAISYPSDWTAVSQPTDAMSMDFRDPEGGTYLRIDWTDSPGNDPAQAWRDFEPVFRAGHSNYERMQITPTTFKGFDAALWEFTYSDGGARLHAADLGFVTGDYGFALNFQTRAEDWAASQDLFEALKTSFRPPA